MTTFSKY